MKALPSSTTGRAICTPLQRPSSARRVKAVSLLLLPLPAIRMRSTRAERIVLPGVGAFADCRRGLDEIPGMVDALEQSVRKNGRPFFGICVGMQLMAERGREYKVTPGLGWIAGEVDRITPSNPDLKIPHMGWNTLNVQKAHPLLADIPVGCRRAACVFRAFI